MLAEVCSKPVITSFGVLSTPTMGSLYIAAIFVFGRVC